MKIQYLTNAIVIPALFLLRTKLVTIIAILARPMKFLIPPINVNANSTILETHKIQYASQFVKETITYQHIILKLAKFTSATAYQHLKYGLKLIKILMYAGVLKGIILMSN